jgi:hypothetical protein
VSRCAMAARILQGDSFEPILAKISLGEFFFDYAEKHRDVICQVCTTRQEKNLIIFVGR